MCRRDANFITNLIFTNMKTFQYRNWPEELLIGQERVINSQFEHELIIIYRDAELGEIKTYEEMIDKVTEAGSKHASTLCDMGRIVDGQQFYGSAIDALKLAQNTFSLKEHARQWLDTMTALYGIH